MSENTLETPEITVAASTEAQGNGVLDGMVNVEHVKEIVEIADEGDPVSGGDGDDTSTQAVFSWAGISDTVGKLIPHKRQPKSLVIPSESKQKTRLEKTFKKNLRKLRRQANGMIGNKNFSADKYEEVITQIRQFRALLSELIEVAAETLELWYKQYVLKVA